MAIKGSLKEASLPDVIQLLYLGRRTGCLALADRHNFGTIHFDEGHIIYASIVNRRDRLGDILVRNGRITAEALQRAIALGDALSAADVELPAMLGTGQAKTLQCKMRDVGDLVRAAAVVDTIVLAFAVDKYPAAVAVQPRRLAIGPGKLVVQR